MVVVATSPITWLSFQDMMRQLGYEMVAHAPGKSGVIFRLAGHVRTEGLRNPVTVMYPDCVASDGETPAYEKNYVIDLLMMIAGHNGEEAILTLVANRRIDG